MRRRVLSLLMCVSVLLGMVPFTALASAPEEGLVAYYNFDGMQDGVVPDVTGNGHDGTVIGNVTGTDGKDQGGQGANFDGASYIEVPDDDALDFPNGDFTVAVWIKIGDNAPSGWHTVMQKGRLTETAWYGFFLNGNQINYSEDLQIQSQSLGTALSGRWTHATAVHSAGDNSIRLFIDGKLVKVMDTCNQGIDTDQPLRIGYSGAGDGEYFQGDLDNLRIYNRALSDAEVEALYTARKRLTRRNRCPSRNTSSMRVSSRTPLRKPPTSFMTRISAPTTTTWRPWRFCTTTPIRGRSTSWALSAIPPRPTAPPVWMP